MSTKNVGTEDQKVSLRILIFWQVILIIASIASYYLRSISDSLLLYLPIALSIILIHWYGKRVLIISFISSVFTLLLWNTAGPWWRILIISTHEPIIAFASKVLVDNLIKTDFTSFFESTRTFIRFILYGILIPILLNSFFVYNYSFIHGDLEQVTLFWLSDFLTTSAVAIPALYFFKPVNNFIGISRPFPKMEHGVAGLIRRESVEFFSALIVFIVLYFTAPFEQYWFVYWIGAVIVALRQGFEKAILLSFTIFVINYVLPLISFLPSQLINSSTQLISVHLGNATMMFISLLVGRVVSDLHLTEANLVAQKAEIENTNEKLSQANRELDRFVYSVSHDLSAPLKSIKGLINISKLEPAETPLYLNKMEKSVTKLEEFIDEVLDYSRTSRKDLIKEEVRLSELYDEILEKFVYLEGYEKIRFNSDFQVQVIRTDKFLFKVILGNLVSNAIKYQKSNSDHSPWISLSSELVDGKVIIEVRDNGEGIIPSNRENLFRMFYRGTTNSSGSGLGLYIAREAAHKLGGSLQLNTDYKGGAAFRLSLKNCAITVS